ncbi:hypothetical protein [Rhodosalinus sp.]|uniref:hypothetical protein n=1 Tax=Rhodosalinus sp. TaxID=2047741 RepID=UPI0035647045
MRRSLGPAILAAALCGAAADAGPWPRAAGEGFASGTWRGTLAGGTEYSALYLEYGLGRRWSAGLDAGRAIGGATKAVAFISRARAADRPGPRLGWQLGVGRIDGRAVVRPGLSLGRGFGEGARTGWLAGDALAEVGVAPGADPRPELTIDVKLDLTLGLTHPGGVKTLVQLQTGREAGDPPFARLEARTVVPLRARTSVTLGAYHDLDRAGTGGLVFGLWQRF